MWCRIQLIWHQTWQYNSKMIYLILFICFRLSIILSLFYIFSFIDIIWTKIFFMLNFLIRLIVALIINIFWECYDFRRYMKWTLFSLSFLINSLIMLQILIRHSWARYLKLYIINFIYILAQIQSINWTYIFFNIIRIGIHVILIHILKNRSLFIERIGYCCKLRHVDFRFGHDWWIDDCWMLVNFWFWFHVCDRH